MSYLVYKHTTPSNKVYIGITRCKDPNYRWQSGKGYQNNLHFYRAIQKYSWDKIQHEIIASNLSETEAYDLEANLIDMYNSTNPAFGYNVVKGGRCTFGTYKRSRPIWITNGQLEKIIDLNRESIPTGFWQGRSNQKDTYIYKGLKSKKINHADLDNYLSEGWRQGRPCATHTNIQKSRRSYTYFYKNIQFSRAIDVCTYLNDHGYPKIVSSTITEMLRKGKSHTYPELLADLYRIKNEGVV